MTTELLLYVRQEVVYGWHKPLNCKDSDRKLQFGVSIFCTFIRLSFKGKTYACVDFLNVTSGKLEFSHCQGVLGAEQAATIC